MEKKILEKRKRNKGAAILWFFAAALIVFLLVRLRNSYDDRWSHNVGIIMETISGGVVINEDYLTSNPYSRPRTKLNEVNGIVIHYTANPGTSAANNRSYFQGLATTRATKASSHYIIGIKGEVIQCIPLNEIAYASNDRNTDTISIECCHPDATGKFTDETYDTLISLVTALCIEFDLEEEDIIRHYDVSKKLCPIYYVKNEDAWLQLRADVMEMLDQSKTIMQGK